MRSSERDNARVCEEATCREIALGFRRSPFSDARPRPSSSFNILARDRRVIIAALTYSPFSYLRFCEPPVVVVVVNEFAINFIARGIAY